jgi:cytochrome c553
MKRTAMIRNVACPRGRAIVATLTVALAVPFSSARAQTVEQKAQLCSACHGDSGVPQQKTTPVIWGQQLGYLYLELRDYKSGARKNDQMSAVVAGLERDDMLALAQYFSQKPWPSLGQPPAPQAVAAQALRATTAVVCTSCHQEGRAAEGLSGPDHARFPRRQARQQSRHVRSDEIDFGGRYRADRRISGGAVGHHRAASARRTLSLAATSRALFPLLSRMVRSAPRPISIATTSAWPSSAAIIKAVRPRSSVASISAP